MERNGLVSQQQSACNNARIGKWQRIHVGTLNVGLQQRDKYM